MDGLEIMEIHSRTIESTNFSRFDAEYYKKQFIENENQINHKGFILLDGISKVTDGEHGIPRLDESSGIVYLSGNNVLENEINWDDVRYCTQELHSKNARSALQKGNVLISIVGTIGKAAMVERNVLGNTDRNVATIKEINAGYRPAYISTFLNSKFGYLQTTRFCTGNVQPLLNLLQVKNIKIADCIESFQMEIESLVKQAHVGFGHAKELYSAAEKIMLSSLGLGNWQPRNRHDSIKYFSQSFIASGRLDAEYYQPKYDAWAERIKQCPAGFDELGATCQIKEANFSPDDAQTYRYIELSDIGSHGNITGATEDIGAALPTRARRRVAIGDVVVSSIEGSLQSVALVTDDYDNALCSTGFYVVRSDTINAETLLVLFKSEAYQNLFKQACTGTILTAMPKEFFGRIPVPVIDVHVQQTIAEKVQASFAARRQSQQLLELAKQTVERAIESSEAEALEWLEVQLRQVA